MVSARSIVVRASPTLPTEGSTPASARRSVYLMETWYWADSSGQSQHDLCRLSVEEKPVKRSLRVSSNQAAFRGRELRAAATAAISAWRCVHAEIGPFGEVSGAAVR